MRNTGIEAIRPLPQNQQYALCHACAMPVIRSVRRCNTGIAAMRRRPARTQRWRPSMRPAPESPCVRRLPPTGASPERGPCHPVGEPLLGPWSSQERPAPQRDVSGRRFADQAARRDSAPWGVAALFASLRAGSWRRSQGLCDPTADVPPRRSCRLANRGATADRNAVIGSNRLSDIPAIRQSVFDATEPNTSITVKCSEQQKPTLVRLHQRHWDAWVGQLMVGRRPRRSAAGALNGLPSLCCCSILST